MCRCIQEYQDFRDELFRKAVATPPCRCVGHTCIDTLPCASTPTPTTHRAVVYLISQRNMHEFDHTSAVRLLLQQQVVELHASVHQAQFVMYVLQARDRVHDPLDRQRQTKRSLQPDFALVCIMCVSVSVVSGVRVCLGLCVRAWAFVCHCGNESCFSSRRFTHTKSEHR